MVLNKKVASEHSCAPDALDWNIVGHLGESSAVGRADCDCGKIWLAKVVDNSRFAALFYVSADDKLYCSCGETPKISYRLPFNGDMDRYELACLECHTSMPRMNFKRS